MTDDKTALRELLAKGSDATFLREMIGFAAHGLMLVIGDNKSQFHLTQTTRPSTQAR